MKASSNLIISAGGVLTSILTVGMNYALAAILDFNFISLMFWFVIPGGALVAGMAAASGYYAAARITHAMPSRVILLSMVAVGVGTWLLSHWLAFFTVRLEDGTRASDVATFWQYFRASAESTRLTLGTSYDPGRVATGRLGLWGYGYQGLQLLGFMAGGVFSYRLLLDVEACERCRKYTRTQWVLTAASPQAFHLTMDYTGIQLPGFVEDVKAVLEERQLIGLNLLLSTCPGCGAHWVRPGVVMQSGRQTPETVKLTRYSVQPERAHRLQHLPAPAARPVTPGSAA